MRYFTKEWYELMQRLDYTICFRKIPDKVYTEEEIQSLYERELKRAVSAARKEYNTPPSFICDNEFQQPGAFTPEELSKYHLEEKLVERICHETNEEVKKYFENMKTAFENRPPYDPAEDIKTFKKHYRNSIRYMDTGYWPSWLLETVDKRLLALDLIPKSAFKRLKEEERRNKSAFDKIEKAAEKELENQDIPDRIRDCFSFHDSYVLELKKVHSDAEMYLNTTWGEVESLYTKVIFKKVHKIEREKGLVFRTSTDQSGGKYSNCQYLYEELYRNEDGYEIHMLLWTKNGLRYLTIWCEDIDFEYVNENE